MIVTIDGVEYVLLPRRLTDYQKSKLGSEEAVLLQQEVLDQLVMNRSGPESEAQSAISRAIFQYEADKKLVGSDADLIQQMRGMDRVAAIKFCREKKGLALRDSMDFWVVHCQGK